MTAIADPFAKWLEPQKEQKRESDPFDRWATPPSPKEERKASPSAILEILPQLAKGVTKGALGTYGDIIQFLGLQPSEELEGENQRRKQEFESLGRLEKGEQSLADIMSIAEDEPLPSFSRIATSEDIGRVIEKAGGPKKPETAFGRGAERIGQLIGAGPTVGSALLKAPIAAGAAGQSLEELGAPPWAQAAAEMIAFLGLSPTKKALTSKDPEVKNAINRAKKLGYSEEDITLAKNALEDRDYLKKISKLNPEAEKRFASTLAESEKKIDNIIEKSFPGIEKGTEALKNASSEIYTELESFAKNVPIKNPDVFLSQSSQIIEDLSKSLANTPQEKQVMGLLEDAFFKASKGVNADEYINFYQGLNQIGNWSSPKQREFVFKKVKDAIKKTFRENGTEGQKLAGMLENANESWMKFRKAEDVVNLLGKAKTEDGVNFKKLSKVLENPDNMKTLADGIGKKQASNIKFIANISDDIGSLRKTMEGSLAKQAFGPLKAWAIAKDLATLNFPGLAVTMGASASSRLATKMLTDPKFQNTFINFIDKINKGKFNQARILVSNLTKDQSS